MGNGGLMKPNPTSLMLAGTKMKSADSLNSSAQLQIPTGVTALKNFKTGNKKPP